MNRRLADGHCHLSDQANSTALVHEALAAGMELICLGGVAPDEWRQQLTLQQAFPAHILTSFGIHPWTVDGLSSTNQLDEQLSTLEALLPDAVAIGEIGLDCQTAKSAAARKWQLLAFRRQLALAKNHDKPLVLHSVRSHHQILAELRSFAPRSWQGLVHNFIGSTEQAIQFQRFGLFISAGVRTLRSAKSLAAIRHLGMDHLILESDGPLTEEDRTVPIHKTIGQLATEFAAALAIERDQVLEKNLANIRAAFKGHLPASARF